MIKKIIKFFEKNLPPYAKVAIGVAIVALIAFGFYHPADPKSATVMITNMTGTSGGTGIILHSSDGESKILTNNHVCELVKKRGGVVVTQDNRQHIVSSLIPYSKHDLCVVFVQENLHAETKLSDKAPEILEEVAVWGFPALRPTTVSKGHISDDRIINVLAGFRKCTPEEENSSNLGLLCALMGGMPMIKVYQATLVTALIEGGSSGSAVRNSKNELIGVVFAGSGRGLSHAFTVPYNYVVDFLHGEAIFGNKQTPDYTIDIANTDQEKKSFIDRIKEFCSTEQNKKHEICGIVNNSVELL